MISIALALGLMSGAVAGTVTLSVDAEAGRQSISPLLYGKNNNFNGGGATKDSLIKLYNEAGLRFSRDGGGNNCTKYNWRRKLSSHPDWYNNVYANDWDIAAKQMQARVPGCNGLFSLQLLGWAAKTTSANFNDWAYNGSAWTADAAKNWAGGGGPSGDGDPTAYLERWPADSTVGILKSWFGPGGQGMDPNRFTWWEMDNEADIWQYTHDDVATDTIQAEGYIQRWLAVGKAAKAVFPGIKLAGPAFTNEWQWWTWNNSWITYKGRKVSWMEYFVQRLAEESTASGVQLLDAVTWHFYPDVNSNEAHLATQLHRVWFDSTYAYPKANGVHTWPDGGWDAKQNKEGIHWKMKGWLNKYFGPNNNIGLGITEMGAVKGSADVIAVWHASHLGSMADHGWTMYTSWDWEPGQWEATHLFSTTAKSTRVATTSSLDTLVSGYSSISAGGDSLTVILVNRELTDSRPVTVQLSHFANTGVAMTSQLAGMKGETFKSGSQNALVKGTVDVTSGQFSMTLPPLSVTAVQLAGQTSAPGAVHKKALVDWMVDSREVAWGANHSGHLTNLQGKVLRTSELRSGLHRIALTDLPRGIYMVQVADFGAQRVVVR